MDSEQFLKAIYPLLDEYAQLYHSMINVYDDHGLLIQSFLYSKNLQGTYHIDFSSAIGNVNSLSENGKKIFYYIIPVEHFSKVVGFVVVYAENSSLISGQGAAVQIALSNIVQYLTDTFFDTPQDSGFNPLHSQLIHHLISNPSNREVISRLIQLCNLDATLLHVVIVIDCSFKTNEYFNINLNLGYSSTLEKSRQAIEMVLLRNKYLNTQDIQTLYSENKYIIIKSFIYSPNISKIYLATDLICQYISEQLSKIELLDARIAYGSLCDNFFDVKNSYGEAISLLRTGIIEMPDQHFYNIETLAFSSICQTLPKMLINKIIVPKLRQIMTDYPSSYQELLLTAKTYAECCMNYSKTAERLGIHRNTLTKRLDNFYASTNLDVINSYQDCVLATLMEKYSSLNVHK